MKKHLAEGGGGESLGNASFKSALFLSLVVRRESRGEFK